MSIWQSSMYLRSVYVHGFWLTLLQDAVRIPPETECKEAWQRPRYLPHHWHSPAAKVATVEQCRVTRQRRCRHAKQPAHTKQLCSTSSQGRCRADSHTIRTSCERGAFTKSESNFRTDYGNTRVQSGSWRLERSQLFERVQPQDCCGICLRRPAARMETVRHNTKSEREEEDTKTTTTGCIGTCRQRSPKAQTCTCARKASFQSLQRLWARLSQVDAGAGKEHRRHEEEDCDQASNSQTPADRPVQILRQGSQQGESRLSGKLSSSITGTNSSG